MKFNDAMTALDRYIQSEHSGNISAAARALGVKYAAFSRWIKRERVPNADDFFAVMDKIGLNVSPRSREASREVCFVDARVVSAGSNQSPPHAEDYLAVPLVEEVGAGPGIIPQGELLSWFLVYRHQDAVRYKSDLIAVQIGKHSTSMEPTLHAGDVVLVDRQDKSTQRPGRMMLVMDPDGSGKIKRVAVEQKNNDWRITFYSDNAADNPPEIYSLREDFLNDWNRAIAGRVIWAWSDVSSK